MTFWSNHDFPVSKRKHDYRQKACPAFINVLRSAQKEVESRSSPSSFIDDCFVEPRLEPESLHRLGSIHRVGVQMVNKIRTTPNFKPDSLPQPCFLVPVMRDHLCKDFGIKGTCFQSAFDQAARRHRYELDGNVSFFTI